MPKLDEPEIQIQPKQFYTLDEIYALPEEQESFVVENLLCSSGTSLLTGKPKSGKSHLVRQLAASITTGEPFLGREVSQGQVLYFALEEKIREVGKHFRTLGADARCVRVCPFVNIQNPVKQLEEAVAGLDDLRLIIIDPLAHFTRFADMNKYAEVVEAMKPLTQYMRGQEGHLLAVHHAKKQETFDPEDGTLGSTALNGAVDTILSFRKKVALRQLSASSRYSEAMPPTNLNWDSVARKMSVAETVEEASLRSQIANKEQKKFSIRSFLIETPVATQADILSISGKNEEILANLNQLIREDLVERTGTGQRGDPYLYSLARIRRERPVNVGIGANDDSR